MSGEHGQRPGQALRVVQHAHTRTHAHTHPHSHTQILKHKFLFDLPATSLLWRQGTFRTASATSRDLGVTQASSWLHCTVPDLALSPDSRPNSSPEACRKGARCGQAHQTWAAWMELSGFRGKPGGSLRVSLAQRLTRKGYPLRVAVRRMESGWWRSQSTQTPPHTPVPGMSRSLLLPAQSEGPSTGLRDVPGEGSCPHSDQQLRCQTVPAVWEGQLPRRFPGSAPALRGARGPASATPSPHREPENDELVSGMEPLPSPHPRFLGV